MNGISSFPERENFTFGNFPISLKLTSFRSPSLSVSITNVLNYYMFISYLHLYQGKKLLLDPY